MATTRNKPTRAAARPARKTPGVPDRKSKVGAALSRRVETTADRVPAIFPPRPPANAEIIARQGFVIDATGAGPHAVPEVVLLANAEGLKYLSAVFTHLAEAARARGNGSTVVEVQLPRAAHPINTRLSDDLEFRFAALNEANRRAAFKQFGIDTKSKQQGSLFERYQEVASHFERLNAAMGRDQWRRDHRKEWERRPVVAPTAVAPHAAQTLAEAKTTPVPTGRVLTPLAVVGRTEMTTASLPSLPPPPTPVVRTRPIEPSSTAPPTSKKRSKKIVAKKKAQTLASKKRATRSNSPQRAKSHR